MTTSQVLVLFGTIWIAPHFHPFVGTTFGVGYIIVAACIGLGWL